MSEWAAAAYKLPHVVHQIAEIPRTGSGKIIRYKLRETVISSHEQTSGSLKRLQCASPA